MGRGEQFYYSAVIIIALIVYAYYATLRKSGKVDGRLWPLSELSATGIIAWFTSAIRSGAELSLPDPLTSEIDRLKPQPLAEQI